MTAEDQCYNLTQNITLADGSCFKCTNMKWWTNALRDRVSFDSAVWLFPPHIQEKLWDIFITEKQEKTPHSPIAM